MTAARDPEFYLAHASYVRNLARRLVYDPHAADDLFQAAWLAALERAPIDGSAPRRWLAALVRNLATKTWLKNARRRAREQQAEPRQPDGSPAEVLAHESERQRVVKALLDLEEPYRSALILRFFDGLEPSRIGERTGAPLETVRTRIKRGLRRLRERLARDGALGVAMACRLRLGAPSVPAVVAWTGHGMMLMSTAKKVALTITALLAVGLGVYGALPEATADLARAEPAPPLPVSSAPVPPAPTTTAPDATAVERVGASPAPTLQKTTGDLTVHVQWADHEPAAGIRARVGMVEAANFEAGVLEAQSDPAGTFTIGGLPPGQVQVELDRGTRSFAEIHAGKRVELTVVIPAGVEIRGRVRDFDDRPAPGAEIYMVCGSFEHAGHVVATAAIDGSFVIRDAPPQKEAAVSARAKDRAPTRQVVVDAGVGARVEIELAFTARGGAIVGTVVDADDQPVAGALFVVGNLGDFDRRRKQSGERPPVGSRRTTTDELGTFRVEGLATGVLPVAAIAAGFAPWSGEVGVQEAAAARCDVHLQPGVRLRGVVHDERGAVVAAARVRVGQWGIAAVAASAAADGTYELRGLPLGEFRAMAEGKGVGEARATLFGRSGATLSWDPVLSRDTTLRGRIDAQGRPLAGFRIDARGMPAAHANWFRDGVSDRDGRFEITNCPPVLLHLDVRSPSSGQCLVARMDDVDPLGGEVVVAVDSAREPTAKQRGRVVDTSGKPVAGAEVTILPLAYEWGGGQVAATDAEGRFRSTECPAGDWHLLVHAEGRATRSTAPRPLAVGGTLDWGDVVLPRGGTVVATVTADAGIDLATTSITLGDPWVGIANDKVLQGAVTFRAIADGQYRLIAYGRDVALRAVPVTVRDEAETRVAVHLTRGIEVSVDVVDGSGRSVDDRIETELFCDGSTRIDTSPLTPTNEPMRWIRRLPPGNFELRLRDHLGRTAVLTFAVAAGSPQRWSATMR